MFFSPHCAIVANCVVLVEQAYVLTWLISSLVALWYWYWKLQVLVLELLLAKRTFLLHSILLSGSDTAIGLLAPAASASEVTTVIWRYRNSIIIILTVSVLTYVQLIPLPFRNVRSLFSTFFQLVSLYFTVCVVSLKMWRINDNFFCLFIIYARYWYGYLCFDHQSHTSLQASQNGLVLKSICCMRLTPWFLCTTSPPWFGDRKSIRPVKQAVDGRPPRYAHAPCTLHATAQLQPKHALRRACGAQRALLPVALACGLHEYSRCTRQTSSDVRQRHCLMPLPRGRGHNNFAPAMSKDYF